jgi:hypothetical protein
LLGNYQRIAKHAKRGSGFFGTRMTTMDQLVTSRNKFSDSFTFGLQEIANTRFKDYIGYNGLDIANRCLADLLFSGTTINKLGEEVDLLEIEMDIGFVGNPNVGSVVLNQFKDSEEFREFAGNFNNQGSNDRVFIISSIFGGTGAAGFPTILKNIRDAAYNEQIDRKGFLRDSIIGALTVMPYFNIEKSDKSPIKQSDFISKTKAALHYYKQNVTDDLSRPLNAMYYIGDTLIGKAYENDPGDNGQKNDAHFVELASALAVIDFLEIPDYELKTESGSAVRPIYKSFSIREDTSQLNFMSLEDETGHQIQGPLSQLTLMFRYLNESMASSLGKQAWSTTMPIIDSDFMEDDFYRSSVREFFQSYGEWLSEMANNERGFSPFALNSAIDAFIVGKSSKKTKFLMQRSVSHDDVNHELGVAAQTDTYASSEEKFLSVFYQATKEVLSKYYGIR